MPDPRSSLLPPSRRRPLLATLGLLATLALLLAPGLTGTAQAQDGYTYWSYLHVEDGAWAFADKGAGQVTPPDGGVEGWRYGTATQQVTRQPRADLQQLTFADVCGGTEPVDGKKRVAVLIDYGTSADAPGDQPPPDPRAACAQVSPDATGQQVLAAVADVRMHKGLVCGIDGYPAEGCSVPVPEADPPRHEKAVAFTLPGETETSDGGSVWPLVGVGVAAVVLLGGGGALLARRRS